MLVWLLGAGVPASPGEGNLHRFEYDRSVMSIPIKLVLYADNETNANGTANVVFARILALEDILSDYNAESELVRLCDTAGSGKSAPVSDELWRVLAHAQALSEKTDGAFDVTIGPVVRLWRKARRTHQLPPPDKIRDALQQVGYKNLRFDPKSRSVELTKPGMRLDLGGIAKGFICDEALAVLRKQGAPRAMIHAGGDIGLGDPPPGKAGWVIGVGATKADGPPRQYLLLSRCAVATSGDMFQFVEIGGKRYSHIVDPKTGLGLTDHGTVTVVAPDGMTADCLSKPVSILGHEKALKLIDSTPGAAALIQRETDGKHIEMHQSARWKELPTSKEEEIRNPKHEIRNKS